MTKFRERGLDDENFLMNFESQSAFVLAVQPEELINV